MPTHNRPELLRESVESLFAQSQQDWEAIIVDDASSPPVVRLGDSRICLVRHETPRGGAAAKNTGIRAARAPVFAFLDDDDVYNPRYLESALGILNRYPELDVVFMGVTWFGEGSDWGQRAYNRAMQGVFQTCTPTELEQGVAAFEPESLLSALLKRVPMAFQRPVVRRGFLERIGGYWSDCLLWDCEWALRAAMFGRCALIMEGLYRQRAGGQGYSSLPSRRLEQMHSNAGMKERLLQYQLAPVTRQAIRGSIGEAWFDIAWESLRQGKKGRALDAWQKSASYGLTLAHVKILARLLLPSRISGRGMDA